MIRSILSIAYLVFWLLFSISGLYYMLTYEFNKSLAHLAFATACLTLHQNILLETRIDDLTKEKP